MSFDASNVRARHGRALRLAAALLIGTSAAAVTAVPAHAQQSDASLRGTITLSDGVTVTAVVAVEDATGFRRNADVRADGTYNFASLRRGTYRLEITTSAGNRSTDAFTLNVAQNAVLDFDFSEPVAAGNDGIVVTGNRIRSMEGGEVGINITQRLIEQLPQNNRNFLAFADLAPGVQFITNGSDQSRLQGGAQGSNSVNIFIDGVGQKDYVLKNGITGQDSTQGNPFPQLAIGEYRVISSNYKAEFDQVSSVAITAVTKSGTNEFHGQGFVDFTNQDLREERPTEIVSPAGKVKTRDLQFGGALGGPIIKDVAHFFVTYEGKRRINPRDVTPGLDLPVSFFPSQYQGVFQPTNETFNEDLYFGKIDVSPTDKDLIEVSLKYRNEAGEQFNSGINAYETRTLARVKEWRGLGRWQHSEDTWVNDLKVAYENASWNPSPFLEAPRLFFNARVPATGGGTRRGDILSTGGGTNFQDKGQKGWQVSDDFTYTGFSGHTIQVGVKAKWVTLQSLQLNGFNPTFRYFTPLGGTFNNTTPYQMSFQSLVGGADPNLQSKNFQFGIYAQDDWDVTDRLTLNLGIRSDYESTPAFLDYVHPAAQVTAVSPANYPNLNNANYNIRDYISTGSERKAFMGAFQPRLGFTWELDEEGRFALFGGFGRSYDRTQFDFIQQELAQGQAANRTFNFNNPGDTDNVCVPSATCIAWNPVYLTPEGREALVAGLPAGAGRELRFIKNDLKTPYSDQFSLGVRGRFGLLNAELGYSHVSSYDGFVYLLGNRRPDGSFFPATGNPDSPFGNPPSPFGSIIIGDNGLETRADTVYAKLTKRYTPSSPWSIDATYTYMKGEENRTFGEVFSLDFPSIADYPFAPSSGIRSHRLVMAGTADLPLDFVLAAKFQIASPIWLKRLVGFAGTPPRRDVQAVETEGNGSSWGYRQLDLALTKNIKLGFLNEDTRIWFRVDILNVLDDYNYNGFSDATGLRNASLATDGPPRTFKVSTGFAF
ncbi:MAG: TonB-dependent receptor [Sphingomonadales bacterium]|nr:MAG: TonB-dependent receptor [Sphingomonadales bacterium]